MTHKKEQLVSLSHRLRQVVSFSDLICIHLSRPRDIKLGSRPDQTNALYGIEKYWDGWADYQFIATAYDNKLIAEQHGKGLPLLFGHMTVGFQPLISQLLYATGECL